MILKGNQRAGGQQRAAHLMNAFDNERVEIADMRGAVARDLSGAFAEWSAQARATNCKKNFYSLSLNPDQAQGHLTRAQYLDLLERTERSLKLVGQPRAVVFHVKEGREHCHAVWSRIDTEKMTAVQMAHDRLKLRTVAREFARDHGLELPDGLKRDRKRDRFNDRTQQENLAERQQKERSGISKQQRMADIATCWKETGNGAAFVQALESKGYFLARGDRRAFIVVDLHGEVHSLSRQLSGIAKSKDMRDRLAGYPLDKLPDVEAAQAWARKQREQYEKQRHDREPSEAQRRATALKEQQQHRRLELDRQRIDLLTRHLSERDGLKALHEAHNAGIVTARLNKQPKGILAFLSRVTGIQTIIEKRQHKQDQQRAQEHKQQAQALQGRHHRELHESDRRARALGRLEARENRSVATALKREEFERIIAKKPPARVLKPEFDRAAQQIQARTGTDDSRGLQKGTLIEAFTRPAKPPVDLVQEFNRQVENRTSREDNDRDPDGPDRGFDPRRR
jgi:hypothetical protein